MINPDTIVTERDSTGRRIDKTGICECGETVDLLRFTCTCPGCYTDYDSGGTELAPRGQWGWDTGESVADILSVDSDGGR